MAANGAMVSPSTFEYLRDWFAQQLADPVTLTGEQRQAVLNLELAVRPRPVLQREPSLGETNWVGLLMEYRMAQLKSPNSVTGIDFREEYSLDKPGSDNRPWFCQVSVAECGEPFPGFAGGLYPDGTQPGFARKKDAKQYAAKCAVEFLRANGLMPADGAKFPKTQAPPQQKQPQQQQQSSARGPADSLRETISSIGTKRPATSGSGNGTPPQPSRSSPSPFDPTRPSAAHEVAELCAVLGLPTPAYQVTQTTPGSGFWNGFADFGDRSAEVPFETTGPARVGRVENVLGRKAAREMIAEQLLACLRSLRAQRLEGNRRFLAGEPPQPLDGEDAS
ncbi:hypothetical protein GGR56DRAFT_627850 [Xylariaceae sp. FL0804]|nr:hypothetical protein GGR56DRAFT_627850 [Xylariaceae sp. FL0804]